jgi:hypothetical protein
VANWKNYFSQMLLSLDAKASTVGQIPKSWKILCKHSLLKAHSSVLVISLVRLSASSGSCSHVGCQTGTTFIFLLCSIHFNLSNFPLI